MKHGKTITLDSNTLERIRQLGQMGQSYDHVINEIIDELHSARSTRIFIGRVTAATDLFRKRLRARNTFYSVRSEELIAGYRPFIPLVKTSVSQLGGSSKVLTNVRIKDLNMLNELVTAGVEIRHRENPMIKRCIIYDSDVAYFSVLEQPVYSRKEIDTIAEMHGEDIWTRSTEIAVIQMLKDLFISDWENSTSLTDRIKELENQRKNVGNLSH